MSVWNEAVRGSKNANESLEFGRRKSRWACVESSFPGVVPLILRHGGSGGGAIDVEATG